MSIKQKLLYSLLLFIILLSTLVLILWYGSRTSRSATDTQAAFATEQIYLQMLLRGLNETILTEGTPSSIKISTTALSEFNKVHGSLRNKLKNTELGEKVHNIIDPEWQTIKKDIKPFLVFDLDTDSDELMIGYGKIITKTEHLLSKLQDLSDEVGIITLSIESRSKKYSVVAVIGIIVLEILLFFSLYRSIIGTVSSVENTTKKIASGDLTYEITLHGKDEMSSIGIAINAMVNSLKEVLSNLSSVSDSVSSATSEIGRASKDILSASELQSTVIRKTVEATSEIDNSTTVMMRSSKHLSESAEDTASSILQMKSAIDTIAKHSDKFTNNANETTASVEEMVTNVKEISDNLKNFSASSVEVASAVEEVKASVKSVEDMADQSVILAKAVKDNASNKGINASNAAITGMETIKKSVLKLSEGLNILGKKSDDIGSILEVIDEISDQTALLSVNASILAAQAGEHGKGFSVVANEISSLADKTSKSTQGIATLINSVQDETKSNIAMAAEGIQTVENGMLLVKDVSTALADIALSSGASAEMAKNIQKATAEESVVLNNVMDSIEGINLRIQNISRTVHEQTLGNSLIIESMITVNRLSNEVKTALGEQKEGIKKIADSMDNVALQASQISDETVKQKDKSKAIVLSMDKSVVTTNDLTDFSNRLEKVVTLLEKDTSNLVSATKKFKT